MQTDWTNRFISLAKHIATWSKDPSTQVGAVITDGKRVVSVGYNGPPINTMDKPMTREEKLLRTVHAEENAVLFANRSVAGCAIYVTHPPCAHCTSILIQSGINRIYFDCPPTDFMMRWADNLSMSNLMCAEAGVELVGVS
jgi:dCMP deaminase